MVKKHTPTEGKESRREQKSPAKPVTAPPREERKMISTNLVELRPGLFVNTDQIVSVRVLPEEQGNTYAVMQLSSGEKLNLNRNEFSAVCGVEPRPPVRFSPTYSGKSS